MKNDYQYSTIEILKKNKNLHISQKIKTDLDKLATKGCREMVFSRFPYYNSKMQCKQLAKHKKEGNCVAFSYYMQNLLKQKKLRSFIVGSKIPPKFSRDGYKEICHTAVVLPYSSGCVLFDTAFYFNKAIILDAKNDYKSCQYFTNVYSKNTDKWCFELANNRINVMINDIDIDAYYELKELMNPYYSITLHTNKADKTVFRCEVDKNMISKFYYKVNLWSNNLSLYSNSQSYTNIDTNYFFDSENKLNKRVLKNWIDALLIKESQKRTMYRDLSIFFAKHAPTTNN